MSSISLIRQLVRRLKVLATCDLSPELKDKTSLTIIDYLGAIASGHQAPWAQQVRQYAQARKGAPESFSWATGTLVSAESAAFANAILAHSAIRDDMHLKSNSHIGSIVISGSFALAQRDHWSGEQLVKAIVGGYETASLLGAAVQQSPHYNRHTRPSGICGAFGVAGAAVAAGLVSGQINEDVAVNALAFSANMSSGFNEWAWAGGIEIYVEMGSASQAGIVAFDLAKTGMQCSETLLEGRAGLFAALNAPEGIELFRDGLRRPVGTGILDVCFKPVPGCNYAQTPLAVALRLAEKEEPSVGSIKQVEVYCTVGAKNYPGCDNSGPFENVQQTKMSIQFGVCAVLLHREISEKLFLRFEDVDVARQASQCIVEVDPAFYESFQSGRQPARVVVKLTDGHEISAELPDVPWLDKKAVVRRFHLEMRSMIAPDDLRARLADEVESIYRKEDCAVLVDLFQHTVMGSK